MDSTNLSICLTAACDVWFSGAIFLLWCVALLIFSGSFYFSFDVSCASLGTLFSL